MKARMLPPRTRATTFALKLMFANFHKFYPLPSQGNRQQATLLLCEAATRLFSFYEQFISNVDYAPYAIKKWRVVQSVVGFMFAHQ